MYNSEKNENEYFKVRINCWEDEAYMDFSNVDRIVENLCKPKNIREIDLGYLASHIAGSGMSVFQGIMNGSKESDWGYSHSLFVVDIDNTNEIYPIETVDSLVKKYSDKGIDVFLIYPTYDYTETNRKYRLIIVSDEPFTNAKQTKQVIDALIRVSPQANTSANSLARPIIGSYRYSAYRCCICTPKQNLIDLIWKDIDRELSIDIFKSKITVVDSMMGSGKTTWCINEILNNPLRSQNFIYVTPYLDEITRIQNACKNVVSEPLNAGDGKLDNFKTLVYNQTDIATTHELFKMFDNECKELISKYHYMLIIDESFSVIEEYHLTKKDDLRYLMDNGDVAEQENGRLAWVGSKLETRYDDIKKECDIERLYFNDNVSLIKLFPADIFSLFEHVFVLTFMFEGTFMKPYFDYFKIDYNMVSIISENGKQKLVNYQEVNKQPFRDRFDIIEED